MTIDWRSLPSLTALRAFEAAAGCAASSQAARALNVTHAAVAQQVRALEASWAWRWCSARGAAVALTAEGEQLAAALAEGFGAIQRAVQALRARRADRPVRVTLTASFRGAMADAAAAGLLARAPRHRRCRCTPIRGWWTCTAKAMDLGIRYGNGDWPGVTAELSGLGPAGGRGRAVAAGRPARLTPARWPAMHWILARDWPEQDN